MFRILFFIFTFCFMLFPSFSFALSIVLPKPQLKSPYKVTGIACLDGEHCELIKKGEHAGYYIKSNIPLDDSRIKNIRGNMFTKAVLDREAGKKDQQIQNLKTLAESCKGDVCTAKYDSQGCNVCALNVNHPPAPPCLKGPHGAVACPDPNPRAYNVDYLCTKKGCTGSLEEMAKLYARGGMCVKFGPNPLPSIGGIRASAGEVSDRDNSNVYKVNVIQGTSASPNTASEPMEGGSSVR